MSQKFPEKLIHDDSTKPLIDEDQKQGGAWSVTNTAARDAISELKRKVGMIVSIGSVTQRYDGADVTDVNWTNTANWSLLAEQIVAETVNVAISGGNFTSLKDACDSITDSSISKPYQILVYPGVYTELPFTVPQYTEILGYNCTIEPNNNSLDFITLGLETEIKGCKITPPTSAKCIIASGINCRFKDSTINGSCTVAFESSVAGVVIRDCDILSATKGLSITGGNIILDAFACVSCTTGIELSNSGSLLGGGVACILCTTDLKTLNTSTVELSGSKLQISKFDIADWDNIKISANSDKEDDEALINIQEFQVGIPEKGNETVLGEGDSYTRGMLVYTEDTGNNFVDISADARSASGSTFTFTGVAADNAIYVASSLTDGSDFLKFFGIKTKIDTAIVVGTGEIVLEYWNGSAWIEVFGMECDASDKYYPYARNYFQDTGSYQIRLDSSLHNDSWTKNDPMALGTDYYWLRIRIDSAITTAPVFEQFKLHTNRFEINSDGFIEFFGQSRPVRVLPWKIGDARAWDSSPGDQNLYIYNSPISSNLDLGFGLDENSFAAGAVDKISIDIPVPEDLDTSSPVIIDVFWMGTSATAGDIIFNYSAGVTSVGDALTTSVGDAPTTIKSLTETTATESVGTGEDGIMKRTTFSLYLSDAIARDASGDSDFMTIAIARSGTAGGDTYPGITNIRNIKAKYTAWCMGGHI